MKALHALAFGLALGGALGPGSLAQTAAELHIQTYAGLTITGAVGTVYSIEYITDLVQTNAPSAWRCVEFLQLPASSYLWTDRSAPVTGKRFYQAVACSPPANMVFIPPGTFRMAGLTAVTISRGYWMGKYEVTQGEYLAVMGSNPSLSIGETNRPVESVSWEDATNYCVRLTQQECVAGRIRANCAYRLPTEAEWEYACRAWTSTRFSYGEDPGFTNLASYAWYALSIDEGPIHGRWDKSCRTHGACTTCMATLGSSVRIGGRTPCLEAWFSTIRDLRTARAGTGSFAVVARAVGTRSTWTGFANRGAVLQ